MCVQGRGQGGRGGGGGATKQSTIPEDPPSRKSRENSASGAFEENLLKEIKQYSLQLLRACILCLVSF